MKKNNVLSKILCVFKPKKTTHDILAEAEDIINKYISVDDDFVDYPKERRIHGKILNIILIGVMTVIGIVALRALIY